ncbi:MAG: CDP-diacylglycerol--glycerol-3-phosphate 3-phosphatidyltransferase [Bdellovibrionales bacterium]
MKKLPFYLTLSRIVGAPALTLLFFTQEPWAWWTSAVIFGALSLTDYFDGKLARKYNVVSDFGKFFDPTGDKILVLFALVLLVHFKAAHPAFLLILLSRDIIIGSLRSFAAAKGLVLAARPLGKLKTALQMIAIPLMLLPEMPLPFSVFELGSWILWGACFISIISLLDYTLQVKNKS